MNVNLIPEEQKAVIESENSNFASTVIAVIFVGVSVAIALMLLSVTTLKKGRVADYENQISKVKKDIFDLRDIERSIIMVETGLSGIELASENQLKWSRIIPWFEKLMPEKLELGDYYSENGIITVSGKANSVETFNKFLISLDNAIGENEISVFSEIVNPGYTKSSDIEVNFTIQMAVEEGGLLWN